MPKGVIYLIPIVPLVLGGCGQQLEGDERGGRVHAMPSTDVVSDIREHCAKFGKGYILGAVDTKPPVSTAFECTPKN